MAKRHLYLHGVHEGDVHLVHVCPYWQALHDAQKAGQDPNRVANKAKEIAAGCGESKMAYNLTAEYRAEQITRERYVRNDHGTFRNGLRISAKSGAEVDKVAARNRENRRKYAAKTIQKVWNEQNYDARSEKTRQNFDKTMF